MIDSRESIILKRGSTEFKIGGAQAADVVRGVFAATADGGATADEICALFAAPNRPAIADLVQQLAARRLLVSADEAECAVPESSLEVFYWHFGEPAQAIDARLSSKCLVIVGVNAIARQLAASLTAAGQQNLAVVDYPFLRNLRLFDATGSLAAPQWPASLPTPLPYEQWVQSLKPEALDCLIEWKR